MAPKRPTILRPDAEQHRISVNPATWTRTIVAAAQDRTTASAIVELALQEWLTVRGK
jgi:hypothetical protein